MKILENLEKQLSKKRIPLSVTLEITKKCNLNCIHCYVDHSDIEGELTLEQWKDIIDQLDNMGVFIFTLSGGEIFVKSYTWDIIEYIRSKNLGVKIITSSTTLSDNDLNKLIKYNILEVGISIYSDIAEDHDKITRVKGSFIKSLKNIRYLTKNGVKVTSRTPIMIQNYKRVDKIFNLMKNSGAIPLFDLTITEAQNKVRDPQKYSLNQEQTDYLFKNDDIREIIISKEYVEQSCSFDRVFNFNEHRCNAAISTMWINSKGDVYPCIQFPYSVGSIKDNKIEEIWNSEDVKKVLELTRYKNYIDCHNCDFKNYCTPCIALSIMEGEKSCNFSSKREAISLYKYLNGTI